MSTDAEKRKGTSYAEMYWWASGEVEHLKLQDDHFPSSAGRTNAIRRAEATLRLIAFCWDHAEDIKAIAARDAAKKERAARAREQQNSKSARHYGTSEASSE